MESQKGKEELLTRTDRERRGAAKKIKELEEALMESQKGREEMQKAHDKEKESIAKSCEARIAGLRLEREGATQNKALMKRLESELTELKGLSTMYFEQQQQQQQRTANAASQR